MCNEILLPKAGQTKAFASAARLSFYQILTTLQKQIEMMKSYAQMWTKVGKTWQFSIMTKFPQKIRWLPITRLVATSSWMSANHDKNTYNCLTFPKPIWKHVNQVLGYFWTISESFCSLQNWTVTFELFCKPPPLDWHKTNKQTFLLHSSFNRMMVLLQRCC